MAAYNPQQGNPYYVQPANPLGGLPAALGNYVGQQRQAEEQAALQEETSAMFQSGDLNAIADFSLANPEMGQRMESGWNFGTVL